METAILVFQVRHRGHSLQKYLPAYVSEKGKNLATKKDLGAITKGIESAKQFYATELAKVQASLAAQDQQRLHLFEKALHRHLRTIDRADDEAFLALTARLGEDDTKGSHGAKIPSDSAHSATTEGTPLSERHENVASGLQIITDILAINWSQK